MEYSENILMYLNDKQREAVLHTEGPLLVLAGAGSGKTRVLTHRIAYLIENGVMPWQILAITFTNKAAGEMRERVDAMLFGSGADVFVSTFHSMCVRILRREIKRLGYGRDFTIYDTDDQRTLMKQVIKSLNLDTKEYRERAALSVISAAKNEMRDWELFRDEAEDFYTRNLARIYEEYEKQMKNNNALDFDDLLLKTVELFKEFPEALMGFQERFHYIMVDEYQDTNTVQFEIVRMLSAKYRNLCVVGDDDQSIYRFRGANIENILSFERTFPGAAVIKLEQNYRSTKRILAAANEVIKNNRGRKEKVLWTENAEGEKPVFKEYQTAGAEAEAIIREARSAPFALRDQAVLYRTNAQSRLLEEQCIRQNVPYIIVGGVNFYQRREIKDMLSYLRITANGVDNLACERIINVPKRGIGQTTVDRVKTYAAMRGISMYDALKVSEEINGIGAATAKKIKGFVELIERFREQATEQELPLKALIETVRDETGYAEELKKEGAIEAETRLENIEELINKAASYEEGRGIPEEGGAVRQAVSAASVWPEGFERAEGFGEEGLSDGDSEGEPKDLPEERPEAAKLRTLAGFLEEVSLIADIDRKNDTDDVLTMMTLHSAKGLEFDKVYLCGMEEGLFPSAASINADDPEGEIEEERRLCYVGITRARKELRLTAARERMINGETHYEKPSRFIEELSEENCEKQMLYMRAASWQDYDDDYDRPIPRRGFLGKAPGESGNSAFSGGFSKAPTAYSDYNSFHTEGAFAAGTLGSFGSLDRSHGGKNGRSGGTGSEKPAFGKTFSVVQKIKPDYEAGDRVSHIKFGEGTVQEVKEDKKDYMVTVNFDGSGVKRMFAGFAKLKKL